MIVTYGAYGDDFLTALDTIFAKPVEAVASIFTKPAQANAAAAASEAQSRTQLAEQRGDTIVEVVKWGSLGLAAIVGVAIIAKVALRRAPAPAPAPVQGYRRKRRRS